MIVLKTIFLLLLIPAIGISQQLALKHTGGPMGGTVGDIGITSNGDIYAGVYSSWIDYSGLYKSTDNGDNWTKVETQFEDFQVYAIYITEEDHIWIGTNFQGRIYRSMDNGQTWENKSNGYNSGECWAFGESKDGVLFAGDGQYVNLFKSFDYGENWELSANLRPLVFATDNNNVVYAGTHDGLFATTDNGFTWAQNNFLNNIPVSTILIDPDNSIYCGTGYYDNGNGVFYSIDSGQSWTHIGLAGKIVYSLSFDTEGNLFAGTEKDGLYKTTDGGQNWIQYQEDLYRKEVFRLKLNNQNDIFIGSENEGVFRSTNNGISFDHIGLPISQVNNIVFSGDSLIFSATPSGVQKYNRSTKEWKNTGLHNVEAISITSNNFLYAGTFDDGLYKSEDFGKSWSLTNLTIDTLMSIYNVIAINDDTIFASTEKNLRRSFNSGATWEALPVSPSYFRSGLIFNEFDNSIFVTGYNSPHYILYRSTNYGSSFDSLLTGFTVVKSNGLYSSNNYVSLAASSSTGGIFLSSDNGLNWLKIISDKNMRCVYLNDNGTFLAGALDSLFYSDNISHNIVSLTYSLKPLNYVNEIEEDINGTLFFGTYIEGLFEAELITGIKDDSMLSNGYYLSQNYPNPFNPTTKIKYTIPIIENHKSVIAQLKIYDILGNEIVTLVNEPKPAGTYEVEFDGTELSSGVYIYRITTTGFSESNKMLLLK